MRGGEVIRLKRTKHGGKGGKLGEGFQLGKKEGSSCSERDRKGVTADKLAEDPPAGGKSS